MPRLTWTDDLAVGIDVIDTQHKRILDYINQLSDMEGNSDRTVVGEVLEALIDYTYTHFAFEETVMEDVGYTNLEPHKEIHARFCDRMDEFKKRFRGGEDVAGELCAMLADWLIKHIKVEDTTILKSRRAS